MVTVPATNSSSVGAEARRVQFAGTETRRNQVPAHSRRRRSILAPAQPGERPGVGGGAGFIPLEFATAAAQRGLDVTVIDFAQRPRPTSYRHPCRTSSPRCALTSALGCVSRMDSTSLIGDNGHVASVAGTSGTTYPYVFAVVGLGVVPDDDLAAV